MKELIVGENDAGQRLDKFLKKSTTGLPDSLLYKYLRKKCVKINGRHITDPGQMLVRDDRIQVYMNEGFFVAQKQSFLSLVPDLKLAYEDRHIMVCEKPAGMSCHTDETQKYATLLDHCKAYLFRKREYDPENELSFAPALANRIDRNTAGLVLCAKDASSLRALNSMIRAHRITKEYRALVYGIPAPKSGTLQHYLCKDSEKNLVSVFDSPCPGARKALTHYKTIRTTDHISLVEISLETGRTHQIRAQFAHIGCPLVGDSKYGDVKGKDTFGFSHQALLSYRLTFHPLPEDEPLCYLNQKRVELKTPDPRFF